MKLLIVLSLFILNFSSLDVKAGVNPCKVCYESNVLCDLCYGNESKGIIRGSGSSSGNRAPGDIGRGRTQVDGGSAGSSSSRGVNGRISQRSRPGEVGGMTGTQDTRYMRRGFKRLFCRLNGEPSKQFHYKESLNMHGLKEGELYHLTDASYIEKRKTKVSRSGQVVSYNIPMEKNCILSVGFNLDHQSFERKFVSDEVRLFCEGVEVGPPVDACSTHYYFKY